MTVDAMELDGYPFKNYWLRSGKRLKNGVIREPSYRILRLYLIEKYGVCYWCGREVRDYPHIDGETRNWADLATIDHIEPRPFRDKYMKVEKVLACHKCNARRNRETLKLYN